MKINFERQTRHGIYRDAITLPDTHTYTESELDAMMDARAEAWATYMDNPPQPEPEPEYIEIDGVQYQKVQ